jgi:Flp pilus assembly protein TadG
MALILPLLLGLLLGIIEFGVVVWRYNTVSNAAREGARAGVVSACASGTVTAAAQRLTTGLIPAPTVVPSAAGDNCTVAVTYTHSLITGPFLATVFGVDGTINLSARSSMIIE